MATQARDLGISDIDESAVLGPAREFTQAIARYFYEYGEPSDRTAFAGLRYTSRLNLEWECWALFADRIRHSPGMPGLPESIFPDDADLIEIARLWSLTIEGLCGSNALDRP